MDSSVMQHWQTAERRFKCTTQEVKVHFKLIKFFTKVTVKSNQMFPKRKAMVNHGKHQINNMQRLLRRASVDKGEVLKEIMRYR